MGSNEESRTGEIVLLDCPNTDQAGSRLLPAVIISQSSAESSDITVAYMTSEIEMYCQDDAAVFVEATDLNVGTICRPVVIRLDKTLVLSQKNIKRSRVAQLDKNKVDELLRTWARIVVISHFDAVRAREVKREFNPGDHIKYAGRVFDEKEMVNLVDSSLDFWLTAGRYAAKFEKEFASFLEVKHCSLVNSGSSANLIAFMTLTSPKLGDRRIKKGDEVITVAAGFPTTVAPIIQYGAVPVFVDIALPTYNVDCSQLEGALSGKTRAVMLAHTLGNPFDLNRVKEFCNKNNLWLIEDNCDALGSRYLYDGMWHYTGAIGDIGTSSFYPPHHMTMGEGGAVYTNDTRLKLLVESFRDWGRDCWCASGNDNTCKRRFSQQFGELPAGYDHKYVYSHFGYNMKVTDMQAAIGCAQLRKLPGFIEDRKKNWQMLRGGLAELEDYFILPEPTPDTDPSWFGFLLTVPQKSRFTRSEIVDFLEKHNIQTRMLFAGNLLMHPCFDEMRRSGAGFRIVGKLMNTDLVMNNTFWVGVYPGMTKDMLEYIINTVKEFCRS